jgi:hypothetical protein
VERFRARSIAAFILISAAAAIVMQVYSGIFVERDLAASFSRAGAFYLLLAFLLAGGSLWLWLILRPPGCGPCPRDGKADRRR